MYCTIKKTVLSFSRTKMTLKKIFIDLFYFLPEFFTFY